MPRKPRGLHVCCNGALYSPERALYSPERALYSPERALYTLYVSIRALFGMGWHEFVCVGVRWVWVRVSSCDLAGAWLDRQSSGVHDERRDGADDPAKGQCDQGLEVTNNHCDFRKESCRQGSSAGFFAEIDPQRIHTSLCDA